MRGDLTCDAFGVPLDVGLPVAKDQQALAFERGGDAAVALHVRGDLRDPVCRVVAGRKLREATIEIAAVPVVAIAEHNDPGGVKHDVGTTDEVGADAVAEPERGERLAKE